MNVPRERCLRSLIFLAVVSVGNAGAQPALPPSVELPPVTVHGLNHSSLLAIPPSSARQELNRWPGAVTLVSEQQYSDRSVLGLQDALAHVPGVMVQSAAGQQLVKLSIRGSGLASPIGVRSVQLLRDGLPLSRADGVVDPANADPFNAHYIEVYRGANAMRYGAANLGGAINIVSPTGYSHPGLETQVQGGSHGYMRLQARAGQVFNNDMDAFASISRYRLDGSADSSEQSISRFYGNLGFRLNESSEGRFHVDLGKYKQQLVNPLTLSQLQGQDATAIQPNWRDRRVNTDPYARVAYQQTIQGERHDLTMGVYYLRTKFDIQGHTLPVYYDARDYGVSLRGQVRGTLAQHENVFIWGASLNYGKSHNITTGPLRLPHGVVVDPSTAQFEDVHGARRTLAIYVENHLSVTPALTLVAGAQGVRALRENHIEAIRLPFVNQSHKARYTGVSPKMGLLWQASPTAQAFANVSASYEPPSSTEFYNSDGIIRAQRATTYEIGTRGQNGPMNWELALFHSRVRNELLNIFPDGLSPLYTPDMLTFYQPRNIDRSRHTGLELNVEGRTVLSSVRGRVEWGLTYTWSRFRMVNDAVFGNNTLPGVPPHHGNLRLVYRHPQGVYAGSSVDFASAWYADQANTLKAPGYGLINLTLGYEAPKGHYRYFVEARNLANKRYAASTEFVSTATAQSQIFNPGLERSIFVGAQFYW